MATLVPFENYAPAGLGDIYEINEIGTTRTPAAAGEVQQTGDDLKWWGQTAAAVQTAQWVGRENTLLIHPYPTGALDVVAASGEPLKVRGAAGKYYLERTAGGAETLYFSGAVPLKIETASRGAKLKKILVAYELATADLTSLDLVVNSTVYAQGVEPAVTANHGGAIVDGDYDANHNTAAKRKDSTVVSGDHLLTLTLNTSAYYVTANGEVRFEIAVVMQNTGVFRLRSVHLVYDQALN